jgi:hypothetical protein
MSAARAAAYTTLSPIRLPAGDALRERLDAGEWLPGGAALGTGPDSRHLRTSRGGVTVSGWTPEDLAAEIRRETGAR